MRISHTQVQISIARVCSSSHCLAGWCGMDGWDHIRLTSWHTRLIYRINTRWSSMSWLRRCTAKVLYMQPGEGATMWSECQRRNCKRFGRMVGCTIHKPHSALFAILVVFRTSQINQRQRKTWSCHWVLGWISGMRLNPKARELMEYSGGCWPSHRWLFTRNA